MHLMRMLERWAAPDAPANLDNLEKRQTKTPIISLPLTSILATPTDTATVTPTKTATVATPTDTPTQTPTETPTPTPSATKASSTPQTNTPAISSNKPASNTPVASKPNTLVTSFATQSPGATDAPTATDSLSLSSGAASSAAAKSDGNGVGGDTGKSVATGVGVVAGVVGGFAVIVLGIYMFRRHQRRKQMERIGSMEELPRPPSPGPLSRSFTRGHGPRQPIDDDEDDFLTPMDTLPNTHRMDEWDSSKSPQHSDTAMYDDKSVYAESVYHEEQGYGDAPMQDNYNNNGYPALPAPALTAANGRFYSGDFTGMRPITPVGTGGSTSPNGASAGGAIPIYSAMNKYAAYQPGAAVTTPSSTSPVYGASIAPLPANNGMSNQQRPGGGYRAHDSYDAGGYV